jgi:tetratricopeptide (TPR) repeat protein
MLKTLNFVIKFSLYSLIFLMPLFWLPWTIEAFELNKLYLLVFLVALAFLAWLVKMVTVRKRFVFYRTPLDIWILVFMTVSVLTAIFSVDKISSWLGAYGRFSDAAIGTLSLLVLYFLITNNTKTISKSRVSGADRGEIGGGLIPKEDDMFEPTKEKKTAKRAWGISPPRVLRIFLTSVLLLVFITYLSVFGLWAKIDGLPQAMAFKSFNPLNGSLEGLSVFLAAVAAFLVGLFISGLDLSGKKARLKIRGLSSKIIYSLLLTAIVLLLMMIDFWGAWLVLGITMLVLLVFSFWTRISRQKVNLLLLPIALLLISSFFLLGIGNRVGILNDLVSFGPALPQEAILDYGTTNKVVLGSVKENPVFGSGPGTFMADFSKFKPVEFNETRFWNLRFDKGAGYLPELLATTGILGTFSYLLIAAVFFLIALISLGRFRRKASLDSESQRELAESYALPFFMIWSGLLVGQFVYGGNITLYFFFWLFTGLAVVSWQKIETISFKKISFSFQRLPEVGLVMNVILLIVIFVIVGVFYLGSRFYLAEVKFKKAVEAREALPEKLEEVVNLNKYRENYRRVLSQAYLISAWNEANKPENERDVQLLQNLAAGSVQQARAATLLSPNSVAAWENLGIIYRDSRGLIGGTLPFALDAFARATELEPANPFFFRERCRLNLISEERDWDETVGYCQKAIDLKENYLDAHIQLALVYEQKGDLQEAVKRMENVLGRLKGVSFQRGSSLAGAATEIYFQLGRLYFNLNDVDRAIRMFEQAVIITPQYANARYALGLSYQAKGRIQDALVQYRLVSQLVPSNQDVKTLISQLEAQLAPSVPGPPAGE